jgi:uncharacterized protein (DUF2225 family)
MSTPLWKKKLTCPFCGLEFETLRLRQGAIRVKEKWTDFGSLYEGTSPTLYAITVCQHCLVAARNDEFDKLNPAYEPKLMEFSKRARAQSAKPDLFGADELSVEQSLRRHDLAIACHKLRAHGEAGELAGLWLHIVWIHRVNGNVDAERKALEQAVAAYQQFYEKGSKLPEKLGEPGVVYLIGELYRRLGDYRQARTYFARALSSKELGAYPNVEGLLREQMLVAKDQMEAAEGKPGA